MMIAKPSDTADSLPRRRRALVRWLAPMVLLTCVLLGLLFTQRHRPWFRLATLSLLDVTYAMYDPTVAERDDVGPQMTRTGMISTEKESPQQQTYFTAAGSAWEVKVVYPGNDVGGGDKTVWHEFPSSTQINFQFENWGSPQLKPFQDAAAELTTARDPFELCNRTRTLTEHGVDFPEDQLQDPFAALQVAQSGQRLTCRHFATLLVGLYALQGYHARLLGLTSDGVCFEHAVAEVYLPQLGKWVVMDADFNIAYRRGEVWQSAAELREVWGEVKEQIAAKLESPNEQAIHRYCETHPQELAALIPVQAVELGTAGAELRKSNLATSITGLGLNWYNNIYYHARNDYLTSDYPKGHRVRRRQYLLCGELTPVLYQLCPEAIVLTELDDVYFPIGRTWVSLPRDWSGEGELSLSLGAYTPNFLHFEVSAGDSTTPVVCSDGMVSIDPERAPFTIRAVNMAGIRGEPTVVQCSRRTPPVDGK